MAVYARKKTRAALGSALALIGIDAFLVLRGREDLPARKAAGLDPVAALPTYE